MKKWILLPVLLLVVTGVAQAIPDPSAVYCILQGYEIEIRTDEQGNQYGVCVFPDGSECSTWAYYCKCEPNGITCWPGDFSCHWPCKEMRCKEAGESVLVSKCCEGLNEIYPPHIFDDNCNKLALVGWLFLCSDCGNGICESWESKCNCPEDCAQPRIIYVDDDGTGANDGSSWADAYNYLQDALADANSGDEIWVAQGIYKPDLGVGITPGDRTATFRLINGVTLQGGYAGFGEPDANARDIDAYETILSGDLNGDDVGGWFDPSRDENSYHVITGSGTDNTTILDGFTVTGGNANESSAITGGMISHWKFDEGEGSIAYDSVGGNDGALQGNPEWTSGKIGGALDFDGDGDYVDCGNDSSLNLTNNFSISIWFNSGNAEPILPICKGNVSAYESGGAYTILCVPSNGILAFYVRDSDNTDFGYAVTVVSLSEWVHVVGTFSDGNIKIYKDGVFADSKDLGTSTIHSNNEPLGIGADGDGDMPFNGTIDEAAIYDRALFAEEIQRLYSMGEGREYGDGGGMVNWGGSPTITNCIFSGNWAGYGGGMYNYNGNPTLTNCTFSDNSADQDGGGMRNYRSSPIVINCTFIGNSASYSGGGMFNAGEDSSPTLTNCTFSRNSAGEDGGGMYNRRGSPTMTNCTFTANLALSGNAMANDSYSGQPSSVQVANCVFWDGGNEIWNDDNSTITIAYSDIQGGWPGEGNIDADPCFADAANGDYHLKSQAGRWDANDGRWTKDELTSPCIDAGDPMAPIGYEPFPNGGIINMGAYGGTVEASKSYFGEPVCETIVAGDINGDCKVNFLDFRLMALHWLEER